MKKLALKLDDLEVTSFETSPTTVERGTVVANAPTNGNTCPQTCGFSCGGTCDISCNPSCISTCDMAPCFTIEETCFC
ncbi:MAG TPA: pinensin family lanthipeptide [Longimicrobiaceae bacterium]|nr:pinensin family lanthipeptide [Longimicrobiaceae bacterium]